LKTYRIKISGLVQGVGFRPFVYRIAHYHKLCGMVENSNEGVFVTVTCCSPEVLQSFVADLQLQAPMASKIENISFNEIATELFPDFRIKKSENISEKVTEVSPDICVCNDCLQDMKYQQHRINYPFVNCTNCGPRFSIIKQLPYDRHLTTMQPFVMCETCHKEYSDILDRRFHAQPVSCNRCGISYKLICGEATFTDFTEILNKTVQIIDSGDLLIMKGLGGFNLVCDAYNQNAVKLLRYRKNREGKPFAVMFSNLEAIKNVAWVNEVEEKHLLSWQRPILLLTKKNDKLPHEICNGLNTVGALLPYMPMHYLLFEKLQTNAIVLTSGNISNEPIVIDNTIAEKNLHHISQNILTYNRDIHNRIDDSVGFVVNNRFRFVRRARGYVPSPINLKVDVEGILACGAELTNCFAIGKENKVFVSQHIGDLQNMETLEFYEESITRFSDLFRFVPQTIVCDLHPDYLSTQYAIDLAKKNSNVKLIQLQHHYAHILAVMAEHHLNEKVIGISFDGTGFGTDNHIWGSEFFVADCHNFERIAHFKYLPIVGGDKATKQPWRTAVSLLYQVFGEGYKNLDIPFLKSLNQEEHNVVLQALQRKINCPLSCGAGRLFDAVASLIGLCNTTSYQAEAPMILESIINEDIKESYAVEFSLEIDFSEMINFMVKDIQNKIPVANISTKFHNSIIQLIINGIKILREKFFINKIVLSGGVFFNKYLLRNIETCAIESGFEIFSPNVIPIGDASLALGQIYFAAQNSTS